MTCVRGAIVVKILFVCHGNICRSPMAEYLFRDMARRAGLDCFEVASAATSDEELGCPVYPGTRNILTAHGISCKGKRARQMTRRDLGYYDHIVVMDKDNLRDLKRMFGPSDKYRMMKEGGSIADPWYSGDFEKAWRDISAGCTELLEKLRPEDP